MKKILAVSLIAVIMLAALTGLTSCGGFSYSSLNLGADGSGEIDNAFTITSLTASIDVSKNSKATVKEEITVNFNAQRQGIIRDLPLSSGEVYESIKVEGDKYFVTQGNGFLSINTGTSDSETPKYQPINTPITYTFYYTIIPPKKAAERYYMNVVGQGWATSISDISVKITFPHEISDYVVYYGRRGSDKRADGTTVTAQKDGKILNITSAYLPAFNGITIDCVLSKNLGAYFNTKALIAVLIAAAVAAVFLMIKLFSKKTEVIEVVNFYPPKLDGKTLNPAEMGMLIDGNCEGSDITALIFYWASKSNLLIENPDEKKQNSGNIILIKLNELGADATGYERELYSKIFSQGNRVSIKSLENRIYVQVAAAQNAVKAKYRDKLYEKKETILSLAVAVGAFLLTFLGCLFYGFTVSFTYFHFMGAIIIVEVALLYLYGTYICRIRQKLSPKKLRTHFIGYFVAAVLLSLGEIFFIGGAIPLFARVGFVSCSAVIAMLAPFFMDYTEWYSKILGEILGFKNFLTAAEKSRLEALLAENPQYYYDILPYANVLGVSEIWQDKFKGLTIQPPSYYRSPTGTLLNILVFNAIYRNMFTQIHHSSISKPASSSGRSGGFGGFGGGGGGGFGGGRSGGGFGGGGGRSR